MVDISEDVGETFVHLPSRTGVWGFAGREMQAAERGSWNRDWDRLESIEDENEDEDEDEDDDDDDYDKYYIIWYISLFPEFNAASV